MFVPFERGFRVEAVYSNIFHCPLSCSVRSPSFRGKVKTVSLTERSPNQLLRPTAEKRGQLAGQFHFFFVSKISNLNRSFPFQNSFFHFVFLVS